ncbi:MULTISPECIES: chemotaxis protein CheW [unclassified Vibrio]|uniref:chemotaxis protein CheW n=1 Tax=unclassified Vibrio TaxID=2614977 RepID=UPI002F40D357
MTNHSSLSSEQALDDYFSALLEESMEGDEQQIDTQESILSVVPEPDLEPIELEPLVQSVEEKSYYRLPIEEIEVPKLDDVERLLKQLESTNPVAELELEEVMEQNTLNIAQVQTKPQIEEVQEWDIEEVAVETVAEPDIVVEQEFDAPQVEIEQPQVDVETVAEVEPQLETQSGNRGLGTWHSTQRESDFQVLYFDVNNVTFAVPLDELGGIHRIAELNHLIGRPDWYLGLQTSREAQLDVVDTAKWVMAEKLKDDSHKEKYQYIVMLGESMWGLASTELMGTESLNPEMVRWRETAGKRPWLAGMVKEKMCALVHVEALIAMLNAGLDVKALDS